MVVKNMHSTYEVWQKDFNAGLVELGINGFEYAPSRLFYQCGTSGSAYHSWRYPMFILKISTLTP